MNYYRRFPGDYLKDTLALSLAEDGAYGRLLDHLYATEKPIPSREFAYRVCRISRKSDKKVVDFVLSQFFLFDGKGFWHKRVEEEITHAESKRDAAQRSANARWGAKRTHSERNANALPTQCSPDSRLQTPEQENAKSKGDATKPLASPPQIVPVITLPLNDGTEHPITEKQVSEWEHLYPAVDVRQELREMRGWLNANRARRKTKIGIDNFIVKWLSREQDKAKRPGDERLSYAERDRLQRQADASVGGGNRVPKPQTAEEQAEMSRTQVENERWNQLEKGTLPVTADTVKWVREKHDRLKNTKLPAQDPRPKWFAAFLQRIPVSQQVPS